MGSGCVVSTVAHADCTLYRRRRLLGVFVSCFVYTLCLQHEVKNPILFCLSLLLALVRQNSSKRCGNIASEILIIVIHRYHFSNSRIVIKYHRNMFYTFFNYICGIIILCYFIYLRIFSIEFLSTLADVIAGFVLWMPPFLSIYIYTAIYIYMRKSI